MKLLNFQLVTIQTIEFFNSIFYMQSITQLWSQNYITIR